MGREGERGRERHIQDFGEEEMTERIHLKDLNIDRRNICVIKRNAEDI
jgi:hypothetical protein